MSEEQDVISGVPQGTVLAAILFVIMISDIDINVAESIVRSFADDTRNSAKIRTVEDQRRMQQDLNVIYKWAEENMMEFNEKKFEWMSCGNTQGVDRIPYKTPSGEDIQYKKKVKDLGVVTSDNLSFREHINSIVTACKIKQGIILGSFHERGDHFHPYVLRFSLNSHQCYIS